MSKTEIRKEMRALRQSMSIEENIKASERVSVNLIDLFEGKFSDIQDILCYYPLKREIDLRPFYEKLLALKKNIYFPVTYEDMSMDFFRVPSFDEKYFEKGLMNIDVPKQSLEKFSMSDRNVLIITPGLAFAKDGGRIGYGGGCYDRYFARLDEANVYYITVGVALMGQVYEDSSEFELEENDIRIDYILTDNEDLRCIKCQK